jgi:hypothetical protein
MYIRRAINIEKKLLIALGIKSKHMIFTPLFTWLFTFTGEPSKWGSHESVLSRKRQNNWTDEAEQESATVIMQNE